MYAEQWSIIRQLSSRHRATVWADQWFFDVFDFGRHIHFAATFEINTFCGSSRWSREAPAGSILQYVCLHVCTCMHLVKCAWSACIITRRINKSTNQQIIHIHTYVYTYIHICMCACVLGELLSDQNIEDELIPAIMKGAFCNSMISLTFEKCNFALVIVLRVVYGKEKSGYTR